MFTQENISKALCENHIHNVKGGRKLLRRFFVFLKIEPILYYFVFTEALNLSKDKWLLE